MIYRDHCRIPAGGQAPPEEHDGTQQLGRRITAASRRTRLCHTFATRHLAAHPHDLIGLAQLLGHTSVDTARIYVKLTEEALRS